MFRFEQIEFLCIAVAAIVDTALLLALTRRRNVRYVSLPIMLLVVGAWLWHAGAFVHLLLFNWASPLAPSAQWLAMMTMTAGLLLMPSAMLHGLWRVEQSGLTLLRERQLRHGLAYLPLVLLAPAAQMIAASPLGRYMDVMQSWVAPYAVWLGVANGATVIGLLRLRSRLSDTVERGFTAWMAGSLALLTAVQTLGLLVAYRAWPEWQAPIVLAVLLSPTVPAVLFGFFVIRFNFMRLVLEPSIFYGAVLVGALLVHRMLAISIGPVLRERFQVDVAVLESLLAIGLVLAYPPLRQRVSEALRYLMGERADVLRTRTRQLALELSSLAGQPPREVLAWYVEAVRRGLDLQWVAAWQIDERGEVAFDEVRDGASTANAGHSVSPTTPSSLFQELTSHGWNACTQRDVPSQVALDALHNAGATLAVVLSHEGIRGLLMLGRRCDHRELSDEATSAVLLLTEQLAVTLNIGLLQAERLLAERRALQSEKLSTLGLLASSIAHEVKNPLSSIKTIATVMSEQLGPASEHAEDLRLIVGEIDRLAATTSQLLQFARPAHTSGEPSRVEPVLAGILHVLRHLAKQREVQIECDPLGEFRPVRADENALREIFFNLLTNSIDAAGAGGVVRIACCQENGHVVARFHDSGPGIPAAMQDQLFQPFFTTKQTGTGLGLYVTQRRVKECGGAIVCDSGPGRGTCFIVKLPCTVEVVANSEQSDSERA